MDKTTYLERMLFNYIFEHKLISLKNFKIVSPTTFVNKSNICQKHPHSRPKHVSMNNWDYTEYILVILQTSNIYSGWTIFKHFTGQPDV